MVVKIKVTSLDDLMQKCHASYVVYSPSRGKVFNFSVSRNHKDISTSELKALDGCSIPGTFFYKCDADLKRGIAINEGWTDAVVKMVYAAPSYKANAGDTVEVCSPYLLDNLSLIPDIQGFAEWLITNNYAEIVTMVGDM